MSNPRDPGLVAHWPFTAGTHEPEGAPLKVQNHGVQLREPGPRPGMGAARFDGRGAFLEVADHPVLRFGTARLHRRGLGSHRRRGRRRGRGRARQVRSSGTDRVSPGHPDQHGCHQHGPAQLSPAALRHRQRQPRPRVGRLRAARPGGADRRPEGRRRHALRQHAGDGRRRTGAPVALRGRSALGRSGQSRRVQRGPLGGRVRRGALSAASGASWARDRRSGSCRIGRRAARCTG